MESHVLNSYHQARYRIHGHNRMGSTSESYSSESSCTQNSPDYPEKFAPQVTQYPEEEARDEWKGNGNVDESVAKEVEYSNESSSDDDVPELAQSKPRHDDAYDQNQSSEGNEEYYSQEIVVDSDDDYEIVVDEDAPNSEGQIIQVYAVDPNLDLEASDEEQEQDNCISHKREVTDSDGEEYPEEVEYTENTGYSNTTSEDSDNLGINMDAPVVSNVDEYFIKEPQLENYKNVLEVKEKSVISDVDDYFIKDNKVVNPSEEEIAVPNVDDFFVKYPKVQKEADELNIVGDVPNVDEFFIKVEKKAETPVIEAEIKAVPSSEPDFLPHIEHIKRFLLDDMPCPKFQSKTVQRSCSLPHSPAHINYIDVDDAKTSLRFEDLNLDLSDFSFDESKGEKSFGLPSDSSQNKSDNVPRTLTEEDVNSFLIKSKPEIERAFDDTKEEDDFSQEDTESTEADCLVKPKLEYSATEKQVKNPTYNKESVISTKESVNATEAATSTPTKTKTIFDFCVEKLSPIVKKRKEIEVKVENDDFVDVESLNDTVIPVLEANNVGSLFEQFEASEKINIDVRRKPQGKIEPESKHNKTNGLANGMRLQDAAVQLNKNKMRQILMSAPSTNRSVVKKSQTVHSDHDYCSPKKRHSLPVSLKRGQSLLKPEVLSSNNKILSSRHRSCKNKKVYYNMSSDDETTDSSKNSKIKTSVKPNVNTPLFSNHRKKLIPPSSVSTISSKEKCNISVISNKASKAGDNCSQSSSGSIKLTIKNKSKVILKIDCNDKKDSKQKSIKPIKTIDVKSCVSKPLETDKIKIEKHVDPIDSNGNKFEVKSKESIEKHVEAIDSKGNKFENNNAGSKESTNDVIKTESRSEKEDFYTALFKNEQDIQITIPEPVVVKSENDTLNIITKHEMVDFVTPIADLNIETKPLKKKLNLQEYKLRREGANSNGSSRTVSPEAIFPDMLGPHSLDKVQIIKSQVSPNHEIAKISEKAQIETPNKIFDPIKEASRKILANTKKKQKAEATRKRDENLVMSKIPKVENLQLQPLISDAEMLKIVGMVPAEILPKTVIDKPKSNTDYEEIVLVSVGTNTDKALSKQIKKEMDNMLKATEAQKKHCKSLTIDKSLINFKIKKSENILKQNVFESVKKDRTSDDRHEKRHASPAKEPKIDKERYKGITAAIKSVKKKVDTKISSNSLFASIQDTVLKKAPDEHENTHKKRDERKPKTLSPVEKKCFFRSFSTKKTIIVREYDTKTDHGEDKIILHLEKNRPKPGVSNMVIQTDPSKEFAELATLSSVKKDKRSSPKPPSTKKRTASEMSSYIGDSPTVKPNDCRNNKKTLDKKDKTLNKRKSEERKEIRIEKRSRSIDRRSRSKDQKSRSKDRYESKYRRRSRSRSRRSRSRSRRPRRRSRSRSRSRSRGRSRSVDRYRRYRRSGSPYKPKKRSRSPYRRPSSRRSLSRKRDYHSNRNQTRSRNNSYRSKSPIAKKTKPILEKDAKADKKLDQSLTPPLRTPTLSESSDSSTRSSSSSDSSSLSSDGARSRSGSKSMQPSSSPAYRKRTYRSYSSEARECNTPVEERRIVFVGKLGKDISKSHLRSMFSKFGPILEVTLHTKEDGCRYGFVTFRMGRDAWSAVESASCFPQYDVGFGGRRAFCRQRYADLDGLEAEYTESGYMVQPTMQTAVRPSDMTFEQMLLEMKKKLCQRKKINDPKP